MPLIVIPAKGPALSKVEAPALSKVEGPVLSKVEGESTRWPGKKLPGCFFIVWLKTAGPG